MSNGKIFKVERIFSINLVTFFRNVLYSIGPLYFQKIYVNVMVNAFKIFLGSPFQVFLEYVEVEGASKARAGLNGRKFGGNQVVAVFYPENKFAQGEYDE